MSNNARDKFTSIRNTLRNTFKRRTSSHSSPSSGSAAPPSDSVGSLPHSGVGTNATQRLPTSPTPPSGPSNSGGSTIPSPGEAAHASKPQNTPAGDGNINQFSTFLGGADAPHTLVKDVGGIAYMGFKGLVSMLNTVGYALPPLKAAAAGLGSVLTVIDKVIQNQADYEAITKKLEAIISMAEKYKQQGCQRALDRRVEELSTAIKYHTEKIQRIQERWLVRRVFENAQDAGLVAKSFRDIGILMSAFEMDTVLHIEVKTEEISQRLIDEQARVEEILHWLKYEDITRITQSLPHTKHAFYNTRQIHDIPGDLENPGCLEGTRKQILADLEGWALDDAAPKVCWLNGMAGTGKSSIAHTLSKLLDEKHMLGASFFCSRSASQEVRNARLIIPTVAYKLSQASPLLRSAINEAIENKPDVGSLHTLSVQFRLLLVGPIQRVLGTSVKTYKTVVIDALDECTEPGVVVQLIQSVVACASEMPLKFFISSRDLTTIRNAFYHNPTHPPKTLSLHSVERAVVQNDIKRYLQFSLSEIARRGPQPISWPPPDDLKMLVERSDRLFIYAATAVRYIGVPDVDFRTRLTHITRLTPSRMRTGVIDSLYNDIMKQAFHSELETDEVSLRRETLAAVVFLLVPLSTEAVASLLNMDRFPARVALASFHSVIHVPTADTSPVSVFHASFRDFIVDSSRCENNFLDVTEGHWMLTVKCLQCLNQSLKQNICNLDINQAFSPSQEIIAIHDSLRYSCVHWASHLVHVLEGDTTQSSVDVIQELFSMFVNDHLLHWFECLSALRELESGITSLVRAKKAISAFSKRHGGFEGIPSLLEDARRFLQFMFEPIDRHPLETYHSTLVWIPKKSLMRERYADTFRSAPQVLYGLSESWGPALHVIPHGNIVGPIAFSPDGSRIVVGAVGASSPEIWNTVTGEKEGAYIVTREEDGGTATRGERQMEEEDGDAVTGEEERQMKDKPQEDGDVVTGKEGYRMKDEPEEDGDTATRGDERQIENEPAVNGETVAEEEEPQKEDNPALYAPPVAFSPDGSRIASGSLDCIIRIWNTATEEQEAKLQGHTGEVKSVAFSHKGDFIVSGSRDKTVRVWNTTTYETEHILSGHSRGVMSIAVTSKDKYVVSGSDTIVRIWDIAAGQLSCELTGPSNRVRSVAVSSNSQHIAAASDRELWIWDVDGVIGDEVPSMVTRIKSTHVLPPIVSCPSRCLIRKKSGHALAMSVAFSPDGSRIVSTVGDREALSGLVYIWCATTGRLMHRLRGHSLWVTSVAFSPDGSRIASGSLDMTVRIWDTDFNSTGRDIISTSNMDGLQSRTETQAMRTPAWSSSHGLGSCALSRDGSRVIIGTWVGLVYVWNHVTNTVECELRGHSDRVSSVAFSNDGSHVVSGSIDKTVRIWNCDMKSEVSLYQHLDRVASVAFMRDGSRVVFGSENKMVQIWNPATGLIESKLETPDITWSIAFSHDSSYVVCGLWRRTYIWNLTTAEINKSTLLPGRLQLPDGTRVNSLGPVRCHLYDPADEGVTNDTPAYILSIPENKDRIIGEHALHSCWIPPQYQNFREASIAGSTVCLGHGSGRVVILDMKRSPHV